MPEHATGEFSVWWQDPEGTSHPEARFIDAEAAVKLALSMCTRPAAMVGVIADVKITDGGDFTNFHWIYGRGVVYPEGYEGLPIPEFVRKQQEQKP